MEQPRSREALAEFLDFLSVKGLMANGTVQARKAAASKILSILDADEAFDVTKIDLEDVVSRFGRLYGKNYTPQSLVTYKSRLRSALEDFESYLANPLAFRPSISQRDKKPSKQNKSATSLKGAEPIECKAEVVRNSNAHLRSDNILPIAIRADLTVFIQGLPFDLTESEARKIAAVVTAMAQS